MSDTLEMILGESTVRGYDLLREDCGLRPLSDLALFEMRGEDRKGWLQGQVTQDLRPLDLGGFRSFCLVKVTGQIEAVCDVWSLPDRFLMALHQSHADALRHRVETMVILEDVHLREITGECGLWTVQGPTATRVLSELVALPTLDSGSGEIAGAPVTVLRANRTGLGGWDVILPASAEAAETALQSHFTTVTEEAMNIARLEAGIPQVGRDISEKTMPPEMGFAFETRHVSYNKGCYLGQEVLMRLHSRGHTNRTWMGLLAQAPIAAGDAIRHPARPDAGVVTSATFSPDFGPIGAAMLRNEVARERETVIVETVAGPVEAEVCAMPILRMD